MAEEKGGILWGGILCGGGLCLVWGVGNEFFFEFMDFFLIYLEMNIKVD